ncbi:hypothetical protein ACVGXX_00255, partial [Enterobacter intestinihominis]
HQGAYRRAGRTLGRPNGFFGAVIHTPTRQPKKNPLFNPFKNCPTAGTHTLKFMLHQINGENLCKHKCWGVYIRIFSDLLADHHSLKKKNQHPTQIFANRISS